MADFEEIIITPEPQPSATKIKVDTVRILPFTKTCEINLRYLDASDGIVKEKTLIYMDKEDNPKTREDETAVEGALRFLLNDPRITIALVGFSNGQQLNEAISAVDGFKPIASEKIKEIKGSLQECFNKLCTSCQYCDKCPEGIPVPKLMDVYNYYMLTGKSEDMLERLKGHWGLETEDDYLSKCTECGECEAVCTQKLPIRERMKFISNEVETSLRSEKAKAKRKSKK